MAKIQWTGWRELDDRVNPKENPCPLCGEPQQRHEDCPTRLRKFFLGFGGLLVCAMVLYGGLYGKNVLGIEGSFGQALEAHMGKWLNPSPGPSNPHLLKRYTQSRVNIRQGPGTDYRIVSHLPPGELILVSTTQNQWVKVYQDGQMKGFVYAALLQDSPRRVLDERQQLLSSTSWGDFRQAKKFKLRKPRKDLFAIWEPILEYAKDTQYPKAGQGAMSLDEFIQQIYGREKLDVEYDEIWVWEKDSPVTHTEKRANPAKRDVVRLYWLNGKVQAHIVGKFFETNPVSGSRLSPPIHKIWKISDRHRILKQL